MATTDERQALLAITCPWCAAAPGEVCSMPAPGGRARRDNEGGIRRERRIPISTLDAGCHDARWLAAGLGSAPVLAAVVAEHQAVDLPRVQEPAMAGAGAPSAASAGERPW